MKLRFLLPGLLALLPGCALLGPKPTNFASMPVDAVRFPSNTWQDIVYTVARFNPGHKREFGINLITKRNVVPIHLSVALRGEGQQNARILLNSDQLNMRMYLPDGTALSQVRGGEIAGTLKDSEASRVHHKQFRGDEGLLKPEPTKGYVFFALPDDMSFDVDGTMLRTEKDGVSKPLDVTRSLIAFNVMIDDQPKPVFVGLKN